MRLRHAQMRDFVLCQFSDPRQSVERPEKGWITKKAVKSKAKDETRIAAYASVSNAPPTNHVAPLVLVRICSLPSTFFLRLEDSHYVPSF